MKKKMILDVIMTTIMIALMKILFTGVLLHELLGLGVFILFLIHKAWNWKWIKGVTQNLISGKASARTRFMYGLDAGLLLLVTFIVVSGIKISITLDPWIQTKNLTFWSEWHHFASYTALILLSVHIGLHWQSIMNFFRKLLKMSNFSRVRTGFAQALSLVIVLAGIRSMAGTDTLSNLTAPFLPDNQNGELSVASAVVKDMRSDQTVRLTAVNLATSSIPTLQEYLSRLTCPGCSRHCPLTALRCSKGPRYKNAAVAEYNSKYASSSSSGSSAGGSAASGSNTGDSRVAQSREDYLAAKAAEKAVGDTSGEDTSGDANENGNTPFDYVAIMGLFVAGTHYTVMIPKKLKK
ncbi:MAG TPA: hypothetical protein DD727_03720 [Clostridiales bacterium]|nr:hypothetical protein [Clostridiales bacterium]